MSQSIDFKDGREEQQPADSLDVYAEASSPFATVDEFLEDNNLGLGNYRSDSELYQQVERYHHGMFGRAAFTEKLLRKAVSQTKREIALSGSAFFDERNLEAVNVEGWRELGPDQRQTRSRREFVDDVGDRVWRRMTKEQRRDALEAATGIDREWTPPHLRILMAEHELTRSKDARLLDNLFGRIEELVTKEESSSDSLLGGD